MDDRTTQRTPGPADRNEPVERLGFHQIVPGGDPTSTADHAEWIPQFDLDRQMMARHRAATARRRQGPGRPTRKAAADPRPQVEGGFGAPDRMPLPAGPVGVADRLIQSIVARDIAATRRRAVQRMRRA